MPKNKLTPSKKLVYLIDKIGEVPSPSDIQYANWSKDMLSGCHTDFRYNTEDILLDVLEKISKGTQMEDAVRELCDKAREVFDFYADKVKS